MHMPAAHSDGDSIVFFRRADVIVSGDILDTTRFPVIDVAKGGSIQGEIDALNRLLDMMIPPFPLRWREDRTYVIPGHGFVADYGDVVEYRNVVTIVRDRIEDMIGKGMTLEQVKAADPTKGFGARYGSDTGAWTTDMFVEAVFNGSSRNEMKSAFATAALVVFALLWYRPKMLRAQARDRRRRRRQLARCSDRPHRLLGVGRHARLAMAHGHAGERRLREHSDHARSEESGRQLGSGEGRSRGRAVQVLRSPGSHGGSNAPADHLAGRQHAQGRNGRRHANTPLSLWRQKTATWIGNLAGGFGSAMGTATPGPRRRRRKADP